MTNDEYFNEIETYFIKLREYREESKSIAAGIIGENLTEDDLFFISALNRRVQFIDGIMNLLRTRNLTCTGIIVRTQLDNLMRVFAAFISEDRKKFISSFLEGTPINKLKDNDGRLMTDGQLRRRLTLYCPKINKVYKEMSGFVHLSASAYEKTWWLIQDNVINVAIGISAREELNPKLLEIAEAFIYFVELEFELLDKVVVSKSVADEELRNKSILNE